MITPAHINPDKSIWLPFNVPSSKNNREIGFYFLKPEDNSNWYIKKGNEFKKIRPTLQSSGRTKDYVKGIVDHLIANRRKFLDLVKDQPKPYFLELHFVRESKHGYDFINACQILGDCLTGSYWEKDKKIPLNAVKWIEDDDVDNIYFVPPSQPPFYSYDKANPGVWITVVDKRAKTSIVEQIRPLVNECNLPFLKLENEIVKVRKEDRELVPNAIELVSEGVYELTFPLPLSELPCPGDEVTDLEFEYVIKSISPDRKRACLISKTIPGQCRGLCTFYLTGHQLLMEQP